MTTTTNAPLASLAHALALHAEAFDDAIGAVESARCGRPRRTDDEADRQAAAALEAMRALLNAATLRLETARVGSRLSQNGHAYLTLCQRGDAA